MTGGQLVHGVSVVVALALLAGCSHVTPLPEGPVLEVTWEVVELDGRPAGPGHNGYRATLRLGADGRAGGNAGCNRYGGEYSLNGSELRFGDLAMTRMYCEGFMDLEERFGAALRDTRSWRIADGALELLADERVLARLTRG